MADGLFLSPVEATCCTTAVYGEGFTGQHSLGIYVYIISPPIYMSEKDNQTVCIL